MSYKSNCNIKAVSKLMSVHQFVVILIVTFLLAQLMVTLAHYTYTLSAITRLGGLVCFSRVSFANPVNS